MDTQQIAEFIAAGDASFQLINGKTGQANIYRVKRSKRFSDELKLWNVTVKVTEDGESDNVYIGYIKDGRFRLASTCPYDMEDDRVNDFDTFFLKVRRRKVLPKYFQFTHLGRCGKCRRLLTTEASIKMGMGPKCREALNYN